jgi:hypothetical protein
MQLPVFVTSLTIIIATTTPVLAEFWVSQNPENKHCKIVETMPDGKTHVMIGATSYPTKDEAKAARKVAVAAGQCIKKESMASAELAGDCLSDAKKLCPGVVPGGGKIGECLKTHIKDLSDVCTDVAVKAVNVKQACADDVKQHCADAQGKGPVKACMKSHVADLSDACKVAIANAAAGGH